MSSDESWKKWLAEVTEKAKKMTDEELLDAYFKSSARVGYENSGLVIVACPSGDRDYIKIYKAELLARLKTTKEPALPPAEIMREALSRVPNGTPLDGTVRRMLMELVSAKPVPAS